MAEFEPDFRSLGRYLESGALYPALDAVAELVLSRARAYAAQHVETGEYLASLGMDHTHQGERVGVDVYSSDPKANIIEAEFHILGRAAG